MVSICLVFKLWGCPVFKWHSNTGPFGIQPLFDQLDQFGIQIPTSNSTLKLYNQLTLQTLSKTIENLIRGLKFKNVVRLRAVTIRIPHPKFSVQSKYARILLFQFVFTKYVIGFHNYDGFIFVVINVIFQNVIMRKFTRTSNFELCG